MAVKGSHVEEKILLLCKQYPDVSGYSCSCWHEGHVAGVHQSPLRCCHVQGLSQGIIEAEAPDIPLQQISNSINHLLGKHRLQIFKDALEQIVYKEVLQEDAIK